jgi:5-methylcytosine-specific restriction protein A
MPTDFVLGQTYNRARDIHARFGGQRQSGIVTPAKSPIIFLFTGRGTRHGYDDEWSADGTFRYFGEGQKGDMILTKGNKAIADHAAEGKDLLLFDMLGKGQVRFRGAFNCAGYSLEDGKDQSGAIRKVSFSTWCRRQTKVLKPSLYCRRRG